MTATVGIDLGTTYSVVAEAGATGEPALLCNELGQLITPSVVCFESQNSVLVGQAAQQAAAVLPERTVALIKRDMGTDRLLYIDDVEHTPESISALILRAVVAPLVSKGHQVRAVVTVPAYFGIREREATGQACLLAGIEVLELIGEPVAAAIHYGLTGRDRDRVVLVYDLGGGTFDATILRTGRHAEVIATDGDTELGGADWDRRLAGHLLTQFIDLATIGPDDDPGDDDAFVAQLALTAEGVKRDLTTATTRAVPLRYRTHAAMVRVDRATFNAMTADLLERSFQGVRRLLDAAAGKGVRSVDQVLLVGGSSRMPMVAEALTEEFGWPVRLHDPDFAVAKGAALRARELVGASGRPEWGGAAGIGVRGTVPAASVVPRAFGLLLHDSHSDPSGRGRLVSHVIHQNEALPVPGRELTVATVLDGQRSVRIEVYEQAGAVESPVVANNRRVLDGELTGLPENLPAGSPVTVRFTLSIDGRLTVTASEPSSRRSLTVEACIDGVLDTAERNRLGQVLSGISIRQ